MKKNRRIKNKTLSRAVIVSCGGAIFVRFPGFTKINAKREVPKRMARFKNTDFIKIYKLRREVKWKVACPHFKQSQTDKINPPQVMP